MNIYNIYVVNKYATDQTFWLFLQQPQELQGKPGVYANSGAYLTIQANAKSTNRFGVPVQYVVGAGASNEAVGLGVQVWSSIQQDADLQQVWVATYPFRTAPTLVNTGESTGNSKNIMVQTAAYDKATDEANGWYANQSFGIETDSGFIGMSWSPSPGQTITLTPILTFYVATGAYGENELASYTMVSTTSAVLSSTSSFDAALNATVTYNSNGTWVVTPGKPAAPAAAALSASELLDQLTLTQMSASLASGSMQVDNVKAVKWGSTGTANLTQRQLAALDDGAIVGSITVAQALTAAFAVFVVSGVTFTITHTSADGLNVSFSYSGTQSLPALQAILKAGVPAIFQGQA